MGLNNQRLSLQLLCFLLIVVLPTFCLELQADSASQSISKNRTRELKPSLKSKTREAFQREIGEPAVLIDSENVCFFAPKRKAKEAAIVFQYLVAAYNELYRIVGMHTEYKIAVYAFPKGSPRGWGGTSLCSIEYDDSNLDFGQFPEWTRHKKPHVVGYIEEMAHNFVHAANAQFGWEMIGWSLGAEVAQAVAGNPVLSGQIEETRKKQQETLRRYVENDFVLPQDIPANKVDRIHAWVLWQCEQEYGPSFWRDFFREIRKEQEPLRKAVHLGDGDGIRNARYRITVDCFDGLPRVRLKKRLGDLNISLTTDIKSLHPEKVTWNRLLTE